MCHEYTSRVWDREPEESAAEESGDDDLPAYLNEEGSEDVEVLTDGGDE